MFYLNLPGDNEMEMIQRVQGQRDALAHYIFETDVGVLDGEYCRVEMSAGRCPYKDLPFWKSRKADICAPCIVELIGETQRTDRRKR